MSGQVNGSLGRARAWRWGNWMYMGVAGHHLRSLGWIVGGGMKRGYGREMHGQIGGTRL